MNDDRDDPTRNGEERQTMRNDNERGSPEQQPSFGLQVRLWVLLANNDASTCSTQVAQHPPPMPQATDHTGRMGRRTIHMALQ
jgi:hypothetical protein